MPKAISRLFDAIEAFSEHAGRGASYVVLLIMLLTTTEVILRYAFNRPTVFAWPLNRMLFGVLVLFAGVYDIKNGHHIRIEMLYDHLPPRPKLAARLIALGAFLLFMGVLVWQTGWMGWNSLSIRELLVGAFRVPLYPFKVLIFLVCLLFLLEGIVVFIRKRD
ncbi:MAG: TRAP transporter small permease subunit [Thermodesulfobacteriota bacterium]